MIQKNKFIVLDTECHGLTNKAVYDIGWTVCDRKGKIYLSRRFLVKEIITDPDIMRTAYYHRKIYTDYLEMLDCETKPILKSWYNIGQAFREDMLNQNVTVICAYNFPFDKSAINQTTKMLGHQFSFVPYPVKFLCLWLFACQHLFSQPTYRLIADQEGWKNEKTGNYRTTAEHAFRYCTGQINYIEPHTALEDALIETYILERLMALRKKIPYNQLVTMPWKLAQLRGN